MKDSKYRLIIILLVIAISIPSIPLITHALIQTPIATTTVDNADRREYVWCPLNSTNILSINPTVNAELDGCPLVRVYVYHWDTLPVLNQTAIDTMLRSKGFTDAGENPTLK